MAGVVAITLRLQRNGAVGRLGVDLGVENVEVELPGACDLFYDSRGCLRCPLASAPLGTMASIAPMPVSKENFSTSLTRLEQKGAFRPKRKQVKSLFFIWWLVLAVFFNAVVPASAQVNVTQFHNHESRDGLYIDSVFTQSAAANLTRDLKFDGTISGNVYAQPLYIEGGPGGTAKIIAATASSR